MHGLVQGVFFRAFVHHQAQNLGLTGYVRNLPSGWEVEVYAEGEREKLAQLLEHLRRGPSAGRVDGLEINWGEYQGKYKGFEIRH